MLIKETMKENKLIIPLLLFPWLITEIIEISIYIIKPKEEYKPSLENSFYPFLR